MFTLAHSSGLDWVWLWSVGLSTSTKRDRLVFASEGGRGGVGSGTASGDQTTNKA